MRTVAIIQARTTSTRLPRKCLLRISKKTILEHIIQRLRCSMKLDGICVATTVNTEDDSIASICNDLKIPFYRGSEDDVLDRFYQAAVQEKADIICRVTADDPFKDPSILDQFISDFEEGSYDYLSNTIDPTYPEGIDLEVFSFASLERAWKEATLPSEHEHVTPYIWKNPNKFRLFCEKYKTDLSRLRWTLDKPEDWVFVQQVYDYLYDSEKLFLMDDILKLLDEHPWLSSINNNTVRNEGYIKSVANEKEN